MLFRSRRCWKAILLVSALMILPRKSILKFKEELMARYEKMVQEILARLLGVQLTLLAYYPVNHDAAPDDSWFFYRTNERIHEANEAIEALAEKYHLGFLDLNAPLTDENGNLKAEFTIDGVHMYPNGYWEVWKQLVKIP